MTPNDSRVPNLNRLSSHSILIFRVKYEENGALMIDFYGLAIQF